jgi:hypothetical protein
MTVAIGPPLRFDVFIASNDRILEVTVELPEEADQQSIDVCTVQIQQVFALVEGVSQDSLKSWLREQLLQPQAGDFLVFRRRFTHPSYPREFADMLRKLTQRNGAVSLH